VPSSHRRHFGSIRKLPSGRSGRTGEARTGQAVERRPPHHRPPPTAVEALKAHRKRQLQERLAAGFEWKEGGLVFPSHVGTPLDPSRVRRTFTRITKRAGITDATFPYLLGHTAVSLLLDGGASIEAVADLLGDDPPRSTAITATKCAQ
jgi:site-specific recombinase XerD